MGSDKKKISFNLGEIKVILRYFNWYIVSSLKYYVGFHLVP